MRTKTANNIRNMNTGVLKAYVANLENKIAGDKIGLGKRALHLLAGVIVGYGLSEGTMAAGTALHNRDASTPQPLLGQAWRTPHLLGDAFYNRSFAHTNTNRATYVANAVTFIGGIIGTKKILDNMSKRKQEEKLNFAQEELYKRQYSELSRMHGRGNQHYH